MFILHNEHKLLYNLFSSDPAVSCVADTLASHREIYIFGSILLHFILEYVIIQLMHSFEVNIRICQPENSEHYFRGLTNPDVNIKRMHQLFRYMTLSLFS